MDWGRAQNGQLKMICKEHWTQREMECIHVDTGCSMGRGKVILLVRYHTVVGLGMDHRVWHHLGMLSHMMCGPGKSGG